MDAVLRQSTKKVLKTMQILDNLHITERGAVILAIKTEAKGLLYGFLKRGGQ